MKLVIDCEWNDWKGELISLALVAEDGRQFYGVLGCKNPSPWIAANVMPHIKADEVETMEEFQERLADFLFGIYHVHIIADWPEDIAHFCNALILKAGERISTSKLTFEIVRNADYVSAIPHHALEDARALAKVLIS